MAKVKNETWQDVYNFRCFLEFSTLAWNLLLANFRRLAIDNRSPAGACRQVGRVRYHRRAHGATKHLPSKVIQALQTF